MFKTLSTVAVAAALALGLGAARAMDDASFVGAAALLTKAQASREPDAITAAAERWKALLAAEPASPLARAYAGASTAMLANTTFLPWKKMGHAEDGLALIDKALAQLDAGHDKERVADVPVPLLVRYTAASTFLALPGMFNRGPRGAELMQAVLKHPQFEGSHLAFKGTVWLGAGQQALKDGQKDQARKLLQAAVLAQAPQADTARKLLEGL